MVLVPCKVFCHFEGNINVNILYSKGLILCGVALKASEASSKDVALPDTHTGELKG